jgi:hypothetical protein
VTNQVWGIIRYGDLLFVSGTFSALVGLANANRIAIWNGSSWSAADITLPGSPAIVVADTNNAEDLFLLYSTTGTATSSGLTTVTNNGTAIAYPVITLTGPSSASCVLQWLENQSTGQVQYYNLTIQAGETVTIDLRPDKDKVTSNWRGQIYDNPLSNSDELYLLPGANTIAAFISGTTTGVTVSANWQTQHLSADGPA